MSGPETILMTAAAARQATWHEIRQKAYAIRAPICLNLKEIAKMAQVAPCGVLTCGRR
jgi:hypothetical protein